MKGLRASVLWGGADVLALAFIARLVFPGHSPSKDQSDTKLLFAQAVARANAKAQVELQAQEFARANARSQAEKPPQLEEDRTPLDKRFPHGSMMIGGQFFELVPSKNRDKPSSPLFELRRPAAVRSQADLPPDLPPVRLPGGPNQ